MHTLRRVGHFVPAGVELFRVSPAERLNSYRASELRSAFDIGPTRTMQQDVEFGVIQIVDIALKAISPAVNDPSTAITCIDQLGRILIRFVGRKAPLSLCSAIHRTSSGSSFRGSRSRAFSIRHSSTCDYSTSDIAVSLRLCAPSTTSRPRANHPRIIEPLIMRGRRVADRCAERLTRLSSSSENDGAPSKPAWILSGLPILARLRVKTDKACRVPLGW